VVDILLKFYFNSNNLQLSCVGLSDKTELNIAKLTILLFWLVFIPLCTIPLILALGYGRNYLFKFNMF